MMAGKARLFGDEVMASRILDATAPGYAKALGRAIRGYDEKLWAESRYGIVVEGNTAKFGQHPDLLAYLAATAGRVPEGSNAIKHSVLFAGADVRGAGVTVFGNGTVDMINNQSGHYAPFLEDVPPSFLNSGVNAFRAAGIEVREKGITLAERF